MPDSKISGLAQVAAFLATQEFPVNDSGTTRKITGTQLLTAFPQGNLGEVENSALSQNFTTVVDLTGMSQLVNVLAGANRRLRITARVDFSSTVTGDQVQLSIQEGATILDYCQIYIDTTGRSFTAVAFATVSAVPGAHTYKLTGQRTVGSGTCTATNPAKMLVEDCGIA